MQYYGLTLINCKHMHRIDVDGKCYVKNCFMYKNKQNGGCNFYKIVFEELLELGEIDKEGLEDE